LEILFNEGISRDSLFIQTKFTPYSGQDPNRCPYDPSVSLKEQVHQSFAQTLKNLKTNYVDSLVLHSPLDTHEQTMDVWSVFEEFYSQGKVKVLGISNLYSIKNLKRIWIDAKIKPSIIQNRFYSKTGYDQDIRQFCLDNYIWYQSFWTLTANPKTVKHPKVKAIAQKYQKTPEQIFFRFVMKLGIIPLSGTKTAEHMEQDLEVSQLTFSLTAEEIDLIESILLSSSSSSDS